MVLEMSIIHIMEKFNEIGELTMKIDKKEKWKSLICIIIFVGMLLSLCNTILLAGLVESLNTGTTRPIEGGKYFSQKPTNWKIYRY